MTTTLKSYDGRVGRVYPDINIFITSPNSDAIPEPVWGIQDVRLRRDLNFGEHDPNLNPQFFNMSIAYLALIRLPRPNDALNILWQLPTEAEFEAIDGFKLAAVPLGRFPAMRMEALDHAFTTVNLRMNDSRPSSSASSELGSSPPSLRSHPKIKSYQGRIRSLLAQLYTAAATYPESLMIWCTCQRNVLQMDAFITWMIGVAPFWGKPEAWRTQALRSVVGTVTDQPLVAENCFRAGIPVWFGRTMPVPPGLKVERWHSDSDPLPRLFDSVSKLVSFDDESPPHPTIYSGSLRYCAHYEPMADYASKVAFPPAFDSALPSIPAPSSIANDLSPNSGTPGSSRSSPSASRPTPYSRPKKQKNPGPQTQSRNKFEPVESSVLPPGIAIWVQASKDVGRTFDREQRPRDGVSRGYPLPEPAMLANLSEQTRQAYLHMYLKLRDLLHYRIQRIGMTASFMSPENWRKILGFEYLGSKEGTQASKARQTLIDALQSLMKSHPRITPPVIDLAGLKDVVPRWKGQDFRGDIPNAICTEIFDEIIRISFKTELLVADRYLFNTNLVIEESVEEGEVIDELSASNRTQRLQKVIAIPGLINGTMGFGSPVASNRQEAIYNLYRIMRGWGFGYQPSSKLEHAAQLLAPDREASVGELDDAEFLVAHHYISVFANYFKRAPVVPHKF